MPKQWGFVVEYYRSIHTDTHPQLPFMQEGLGLFAISRLVGALGLGSTRGSEPQVVRLATSDPQMIPICTYIGSSPNLGPFLRPIGYTERERVRHRIKRTPHEEDPHLENYPYSWPLCPLSTSEPLRPRGIVGLLANASLEDIPRPAAELGPTQENLRIRFHPESSCFLHQECHINKSLTPKISLVSGFEGPPF